MQVVGVICWVRLEDDVPPFQILDIFESDCAWCPEVWIELIEETIYTVYSRVAHFKDSGNYSLFTSEEGEID